MYTAMIQEGNAWEGGPEKVYEGCQVASWPSLAVDSLTMVPAMLN